MTHTIRTAPRATPPTHVAFRDNALFRAISPRHLQQLDLDLEVVAFAENEIVFEEGSAADCCYLVESGEVRISKSIGGGQETLGFIGPGDFFGELALFYDTSRSARATAAAPTRAGKLPRARFEHLRELAPLELRAAIGHAGVEHLRELHQHFVKHLGDADRFRAIGVGMSLLAHDLKAPLGSIRNYAALVREEVQGGQLDAALLLKRIETIERTSNGLLEVVLDVLAEVKGETKRPRAAIALGKLVGEVERQLLGWLREYPTTAFKTAVESEASLWGERLPLARALVNLVRNAVEALPPDGGRVELRAGADDDAVLFTISDTGRGIAPEHLPRIFERRFTHGKPRGTGLGLSQVREVVERHGGTIAVESRVGEGTTFRVRIPKRSGAQSA